jgi:hypothetical protein
MKSKPIFSSLPTAARKYALLGLCYALTIAVALPEQLPAATANVRSLQPSFVLLDSSTTDLLLVHCCHAHPLPPYDGYCCHSGAVVVAPGAYYGPAGVVGTSRRVARRTSRRVSRRR